MNEFSKPTFELGNGEPLNAAHMLPIVYGELRRLAQSKLSAERPGQTLTATALVHEAFLRLINPKDRACWETKGHFFSAAAESMRRILIENARRKNTAKHGGEHQHIQTNLEQVADNPKNEPDDQVILNVHVALEQLAKESPVEAKLVELKFFAGLTTEHAGKTLGIPLRSANRKFAYAKARLQQIMSSG